MNHTFKVIQRRQMDLSQYMAILGHSRAADHIEKFTDALLHPLTKINMLHISMDVN